MYKRMISLFVAMVLMVVVSGLTIGCEDEVKVHKEETVTTESEPQEVVVP